MISNYKLVETEDGSPSLEFCAPADSLKSEEKMHSWEGAFSETVFVYGAALDLAFDNKWPIRVFSLGLGLGYNEVMTAAFCLAKGVDSWSCVSFESDPWLKDQFVCWIRGQSSEFSDAYDDILNRMSDHHRVDQAAVKSRLLKALEEECLLLKEAYTKEVDLAKFGVRICFYDAFSEKVSPMLWTDEVLKQTILGMASEGVFATYAAKGRLNRALKDHGFTLLERPGFGKKKQSTLAIRVRTSG